MKCNFKQIYSFSYLFTYLFKLLFETHLAYYNRNLTKTQLDQKIYIFHSLPLLAGRGEQSATTGCIPMVTKNCCLRTHQEATNMAACALLRSFPSNFFTLLPLASRSSPLSPLRLACKPYLGRTIASSSRATAGMVA